MNAVQQCLHGFREIQTDRVGQFQKNTRDTENIGDLY